MTLLQMLQGNGFTKKDAKVAAAERALEALGVRGMKGKGKGEHLL